MTLEKWVEQTAKGQYRADAWETIGLDFAKGKAIQFDPFPFCDDLSPVYCSFVKYVDDDRRVAEIRVPPESSSRHDWFREPEGRYWVHNRYLTPQ